MPPPIISNVLELIGNTPLFHLTRLAPELNVRLFAKLEFMNPGGSIKDRPARGMILDAERRGLIEPGDTIVEPTAGNTGIGLALVGVQRGYHVILVVPEKFSREKTLLMEALGARVVHTPSSEGIPGAIKKAAELREALPRAFMPQQFANPANPRVHYEETAPEIYEALEGNIDAVVVGSGTGGTFSGLARYFKERNPNVLAYIAEPQGSIFGGGEKGPHEVEGIGNSFFPSTLDMELADGVITVRDEDAFRMVALVARREALLVGGSSGTNAEAAFRVARRLPAGSTVVTLFPDAAERYLSKNIFRYVKEKE